MMDDPLLRGPLPCLPDAISVAEALRTLADRIEQGEVDAVAYCATFPPETEAAMLSSYAPLNPDAHFRLVSAVTVLQARVVHGFGIDP